MPDPVNPQPLPVPPTPPVVPQPKPQLPAVMDSDLFLRMAKLVYENGAQSQSFIAKILNLHNASNPDKQVLAPPAPVPIPPPSTPLHQTPAFQLGGVGLVLTGILHQLHVLDPNMAIMAAIVSAGAAFLGPAGGVVGTVVMNIARASWAAQK